MSLRDGPVEPELRAEFPELALVWIAVDAQPGRYGNRQIVQIGRILGIIGMVLLALSIIWLVFLGGLAALSGDTSTM